MLTFLKAWVYLASSFSSSEAGVLAGRGDHLKKRNNKKIIVDEQSNCYLQGSGHPPPSRSVCSQLHRSPAVYSSIQVFPVFEQVMKEEWSSQTIAGSYCSV